MIKKRFITGLLAAALAIGFLLTGCEDATSSTPLVNATLSLGDGTANDASVTLTLSEGTWKTSSQDGLEKVFTFDASTDAVFATGALDGAKKALTVTFVSTAAYSGTVKINDTEAILAGLKSGTDGITGSLTLGANAAIAITVTAGSVPSTLPTVSAATVAKTAAVQPTVAFTLTNNPTLAGTWKVYAASTGEDLASGVTAANSVTAANLILAHATDVPAGDYYVAVTEAHKDESARVKLTVVDFVPDTQTATPTASVTTVAKANDTQPTVAFTLTNSTTFTGTWKVYADNVTTSVVSGVTAANAGATLTLTHASNVPAADYYVAVTEAPKTESSRLKLTVVAASGDLEVDVGDDDGTIKLSDDAEAGTVTIEDGEDYTAIKWYVNSVEQTWNAGKTTYQLDTQVEGAYYVQVRAKDADGVEQSSKVIKVTIADPNA
jgi:hypothetical protein